MCANARLLMSVCVILLPSSFCCTPTAAHSGSGAIYFIAATPPQNGGPATYPAAVYRDGTGQKLHLVRQLFTADQHFRNFGDDLHGKMYVAGQNGVFIIHQDDPTREDFVPYQNFDDFPCWGVVRGDQLPSAMQYCYEDKLIQVLGNAEPAKARVGPGSWTAFKFLQYGGENGAPFQMQPPLAEIAGVDLVMPYSFRPAVVITGLPHEFDTAAAKRLPVTIVASTDRYLALWIPPDSMMAPGSIDASNPPHDEPLQLLVLYRPRSRWRKLVLPTGITSLTHPPVRIFGDWLVTTVMQWRSKPPRPSLPVIEHGRPDSSNEAPDRHSEFYNRFLHLYLPGELVLQNLTNDRKLVLETGEEDSEIVAIRADGEMLYRIDDSIYSAKINGSQITARKLLVRDVDAPQIHWAFWEPVKGHRDSDPR